MTDNAEPLPENVDRVRERLRERIQKRLPGAYRCQCGWSTCTPGPVGTKCSCGFYRMHEVEEESPGTEG